MRSRVRVREHGRLAQPEVRLTGAGWRLVSKVVRGCHYAGARYELPVAPSPRRPPLGDQLALDVTSALVSEQPPNPAIGPYRDQDISPPHGPMDANPEGKGPSGGPLPSKYSTTTESNNLDRSGSTVRTAARATAHLPPEFEPVTRFPAYRPRDTDPETISYVTEKCENAGLPLAEVVARCCQFLADNYKEEEKRHPMRFVKTTADMEIAIMLEEKTGQERLPRRVRPPRRDRSHSVSKYEEEEARRGLQHGH